MSVPIGHRRRRGSPAPWLLGILLLLLVLLLPPGGSLPSTAAGLAAVHANALPTDPGATVGWPTLGGSQNRSGYTPSVGATVDQLVWEDCLGGGAVRTGPVESDGAVFVGTTSGLLYDLDLSDGHVDWSAFVGPRPTTADVSGSLVVVGSADGNLTALSVNNGSVVWSRTVPGAIAQGIAVADGAAYVATTTGRVLEVSLSNGSTDWNVSAGSALSGSVALQGSSLYLATSNGTVEALSASSGSAQWERPLGSPVGSAPAVYGDLVVIGDGSGNVSALSASDGALEWRWSARSLVPGDSISSTPSVSPGRVVVATDLGEVVALNASSGDRLWNQSTPYSGYPVEAEPVTTPGLVYAIGGGAMLAATDLATGAVAWSTALDGGSALLSAPAVVGQVLLVGDDAGCLSEIGSPMGPPAWPVAGRVLTQYGQPVEGAAVSADALATTTGPSGAFQFELVNGTYALSVDAPAYQSYDAELTVSGPITNLSIVLRPLPLFPLFGSVTDQDSGRGIAGAVVQLEGADGYRASAVTDAQGDFEILGGNGTDTLEVLAPSGYGSAQATVAVDGGAVEGIALQVEPTGLSIVGSDPYRLDVLLPIGGIVLASVGLTVEGLRERRRSAGLPPALLSRFAEYVAMRLALIPGEIAAVLLLLYTFGTFLPAAATHENLCAISGAGCASCGWSSPGCVVSAFGSG
ncbi:MAG TPA: PQQ-binding-like beta-propeller repeat protein, partial [Thermoplasmata archaeon]|nr:PQQ-binding-like beta-propeller repeat protein [Thermoplasmata archaeon]